MSDYVLLWSKSQNVFAVEPVDQWLSRNRMAYADNRTLSDYHPLVIGSKVLCEQTGDSIRNTIKSREAQAMPT
jgi:hypothetical protein